VRQIKLIYVGFRAHVKIAYRIVSYRIHLIRLDYSASDSEAEEYCDDRVCLYVCEFVSSRAYLWNYTSDLHQNFCACHLWQWLGPPLAA